MKREYKSSNIVDANYNKLQSSNLKKKKLFIAM